MNYFDEDIVKIVQITSVLAGTILFILIFITGGYFPAPPYWIPLSRRLNTGFALCFLLMMLVPAYLEWENDRYVSSVEKNLPRLLRDITDEIQSGVPLMFALEDTSRNDYGPISEPLLMTMNRINVTSDLEGSFSWLGEKLVIPQGKRLSLILTEAYNTGGNLKDILESSHEIFSILSDFKEERESLSTPYLYVIYLGLFVFLTISWVLLTRFLAPISELVGNTNIQSADLVSGFFNLNYYWAVLFWASVIESIVGGLIGGKIKHGKISRGFIYASVLLAITILFFNSRLFR